MCITCGHVIIIYGHIFKIYGGDHIWSYGHNIYGGDLGCGAGVGVARDEENDPLGLQRAPRWRHLPSPNVDNAAKC